MILSVRKIYRVLFTILGLMALSNQQVFGTELVRHDTLKREYLQLHINGKSHHRGENSSELNEFNYGLGFTYNIGELISDTQLLNEAVFSIEADIYSDSFSELGYVIGASFQKRLFKKLDWGVNIGLIHEQNLQEKSGLYLFPYMVPYLQTNFDHPVNTRILYIPPVHNTGGIFTAQLIVKF